MSLWRSKLTPAVGMKKWIPDSIHGGTLVFSMVHFDTYNIIRGNKQNYLFQNYHTLFGQAVVSPLFVNVFYNPSLSGTAII